MRHGASLELGWEVGDLANRMYERVAFDRGDMYQPTVWLVMVWFHHSFACLLFIPMNCSYSESKLYAEAIICISISSGIVLLVGNYATIYDVFDPVQLKKIYFASFFVTILWGLSHCLHFAHVCYKLFIFFESFNDHGMKWLATGAFCFKGLINIIGLFD